jgi:uncharacterized RmlC-like cupin family protein
MSIPHTNLPPSTPTSYIINQLEGERITIPGSKGVFRILASSQQTRGAIAVFSSGAVLSDAPGFHYHDEAHDVFLVTKGFLKLWNNDKCRIMGPGDFAYVPPVSFRAALRCVAVMLMESESRKSFTTPNSWALTPRCWV